jgi:hypothetical protein
MKHFAIAATARASFYLYNIEEDVGRLVDAWGWWAGPSGRARSVERSGIALAPCDLPLPEANGLGVRRYADPHTASPPSRASTSVSAARLLSSLRATHLIATYRDEAAVHGSSEEP